MFQASVFSTPSIFTLTSLEERRPGKMAMLWDVSIEIDGQEKPALYAQWLHRRNIKP